MGTNKTSKKTATKNRKRRVSYNKSNSNTRKKKIKVNKFKLSFLISSFLIIFIGFSFTYNSFSSDRNIKKAENIKELETPPAIKNIVFIDASFGGSDDGYTTKDGTKAKDITLALAKKVNKELAKYDDIEVVMSRTEDVGLSCNERTELINNSNAKLAVSIRVNGQSEDFTANGIQCYFNYKNELYKESFNLANVVQDMILSYVQIRERYFIGTSFDILDKSNIPSIIVLTGFLTTPSEEKNLTNEEYQNQLATGIAQGILNYVDNY